MKKYFSVAVWFWVVVAFYGYLLRQYSYSGLSFIKDYSNWLHAHSHAAFLGWLHAGFSLLLAYILFPAFSKSRTFGRLYFFMQLLVAGMLLSFPIQGYKAISITLLSIFLLGTYYYAYLVFKKNEYASQYPATTAFAKTGVIFMILSSLSPWLLGPIMVFLGKQSIWYNLDVYFYLHFQYNGWFFMAMMTLIIYLFEKKGIRIPQKIWKKALFWLFIGIFWGYITNTLWTSPSLIFNFIALLSVLAEAWGLWIIINYLRRHYEILQFNNNQTLIAKWLLFALIVKVVLQFLASCPYYAHLAYTVRDLIIGYLHWVMLALFSIAILFLADYLKIFKLHWRSFLIYFYGMMFMILWIWLRGILIWQKININDWINLILVWASFWTFTGVLLIAINGNKKI